MKIVAILDVDEKLFKDEEQEHSLDKVVNKFIGYYKKPLPGDKWAVVVTGNNFYITNQPVHKFNFDDSL